jgi:hypothetical protein
LIGMADGTLRCVQAGSVAPQPVSAAAALACPECKPPFIAQQHCLLPLLHLLFPKQDLAAAPNAVSVS